MSTENRPLTRYQAQPTAIAPTNDKTLKGYLKAVSTLEVQAYNQNRLIARLNYKAKQLGIKEEYRRPVKPSFIATRLVSLFYGLVFSVVLALIVFAISFVILDGKHEGYNMFWGGNTYVYTLILHKSLNWGIGFGIGLFLLVFLFFICNYLSDVKQYYRDMWNYNEAVKADEKRVEYELRVKADIQLQIKQVQAELYRTRDALTSAYAVGVIHPDYRKIVAVCSLYDYLDKGICNKLTGRDGAYAFYEEELRFQRILDKLDVIIEKLDEIIANQHQIASLIKEGNAAISRIEQQNNRMSATMNSINENSAVTAYNSQCAAKSLSVMESIDIYRTLRYH